ncbi:MAG: glycosyl transferase group 1, partial [Verrucomicrobiales bacterium]|nr:glycosyl transferase group 1 [Verrucomicrobiales bacterium]
QTLAKAGPVSLEPNLPFPELRKAYQSATFFWHAAGYGHDEKKNPADAEHFGMTTVEAMAAGCIPLVINKGGQPEIVEHGVSGFVWDRPDQLLDFTRALARDPGRRAAMSLAARERAASFSRAAFLEKFMNLLGPLP